MAKTHRWVLVSLLLLASSHLFSQDLSVAYIEGLVELQDERDWQQVYIGDVVPENAVLRVGENAYAEISTPSTVLRLVRPGTYRMEELAVETESRQSLRLSSLVTSRIRSVTRTRPRGQGAVGGVRGSEAAQAGDGLTWMGGESVSELIEDGKAQLEAGDYEGAYYLFGEAYQFADGAARDEALFYMGYTAYLQGNWSEALSSLERADLDPDVEYYHDHALTLAQLLVESFAYNDALEVLDSYLTEADPTGENRQTALLLTGLSYEGLGDRGQARTALVSARDAGPSTAPGRMAAQLLQ